MKKNLQLFFLGYFVFLIFSACSPVLGSSWYKRSGTNEAASMYVVGITVAKNSIEPEKNNGNTGIQQLEKFAKMDDYYVEVPYGCTEIANENISVTVVSSLEKMEKVECRISIKGDLVPLKADEVTPVVIEIYDAKQEFGVVSKTIKVFRHGNGGSNINPSDPGAPNTPDDPNDPVNIDNPVDENGNKKFIISTKVTTENISPFDYYTENSGGFSASKFDNWLLIIDDMSDKVPSYKFIPNTEGKDPNLYSGPDAGSSFTKISNLEYFRYKTRKDRWGGSFDPNLNTEEAKKEERFYFYRFTAHTAGPQLDNSMFCVDTYSKFLFAYSEPSKFDTVVGNNVPREWTDYAAPSSGIHKQASNPFYLSDPVGYVKDDGTISIYRWYSTAIKNDSYAFPQESKYKKKAEFSTSKPGFSPYKNEITYKKYDTKKDVNPAYTVAKPIILEQPEPIFAKTGSPNASAFSVTLQPAPEGESFSYQWYRRTASGISEISGAASAEYRPDISQDADEWIYCIITNTNSDNGKTANTTSHSVRLSVTPTGEANESVEPPYISQQPKRTQTVDFVSSDPNSGTVTLEIKAEVSDGGTLSYQWYEAIGNKPIEGATESSYKVPPKEAGEKSFYCIVTNTKDSKSSSEVSETATVKFKEAFELTFACSTGGTLVATRGSEWLTNPTKIRLGDIILFFARPDPGYRIKEWDGIQAFGAEKDTAKLIVNSEDNISVSVTFEKIPDSRSLTIEAKHVKNNTLGGLYKLSGKEVEYGFFIYNLKGRIFDTESNKDAYTSLYAIRNGQRLSGLEQATEAIRLYKGTVQGGSLNTAKKTYDSMPSSTYFELDTELIKYDQGAFGAFARTQILSDAGQSTILFTYNKAKDEWTCENKNFTIAKVTVEYDKSFTLKRGETKDFVITYSTEDNDENQKNNAVGSVEVAYTLSFE
ncbi:hypothetical protein [Treponema phagedenis]|uniref:hypothetical protein n=1 Tax=Treponema phagedenis TaxID=162 RepID=UPI0015A47766|nr:hypothetical protein [Treponema phagedenis]NVP24205.1 hypothetical protein [Treponema phagedenis]QLC59721.1 hypothetical protein HW453_13575 [Treponema phagedenis]